MAYYHRSLSKRKRTRSSHNSVVVEKRFKRSANDEVACCLRDAFCKNGGVVLGRHGVPVTFKVKKTMYLDMLNCETTANGQMFSLSLNIDEYDGTVEYFYNDVLNVAKPAGRVAKPNGSRLRVLLYSNLRIGGVFDVLDHIYSFLDTATQHKEHDWRITRNVFGTYFNVPTRMERTYKDNKTILQQTNTKTLPIY